MRIQINVKSLEKATLVLLMLSFPFAYLASGIPKLPEMLTGIYAIWGVMLFVIKKKCTKNDVVCFIIAFVALLYSNNSEGARYFLLLCSLITWSKFKYSKLIFGVKGLVVLGLLCSITQILGGITRLYGFMNDSPTQFACVLLICMVYLLVYKFNNKEEKNCILLSLLCTIMIFFTGTRTVLIAAALAIVYYWICYNIQNHTRGNKKKIVISILMIVALIGLCTSNEIITFVNSKLNRSANALDASNQTRFYLIEVVLKDWIKSPKSVLIGNGSGYVDEFLNSVIGGMYGYLPVHQDFVLILAEFGLVGMVFLYNCFLKKHRAKWIFLFVFFICSFHNGILNTKNMIFMTIVMTNIEYNGYRMMPFNRRLEVTKNKQIAE